MSKKKGCPLDEIILYPIEFRTKNTAGIMEKIPIKLFSDSTAKAMIDWIREGRPIKIKIEADSKTYKEAQR